MITILLEQIIQLLTGWIEKFNNHAEAVENSLDTLNATAADIETNTDPIPEIRDNTGAVITPINNIKTNTDTIATNTTTTASNTTVIKNNINTIATNTGSAAAFAEDCANNTLDIKDKVTTIASDTTQIRATDSNIYGAVNDIKDLMQYYFLTNIVTEEVEGDLCNFDTDIEDYLQKAIVTIPADAGGYSAINVYKMNKNIASIKETGRTNNNVTYTVNTDNSISLTGTATAASYAFAVITDPNKMFYLKKGKYILSGGISANIQLYIAGKYSDGTTITQSSLVSGTIYDRGSGAVFELPMDATIYLQVNVTNGTATEVTIYPQIEAGSTKTEFEIHKEIAETVSLGSTITDGAEVDLLSGIVKINTTPVTYSSITPIAIRTYKGVNNIYSDIGSTNVIYRETLKHYLDKNNQ